ncbi:MAG: SulP family inorganic anion transporter [Bacteroidota bacterium]
MMRQLRRYLPVIEWLSRYRKSYLNGDISAGLTIGIMLIPQGMAYALIAGIPPVYGLYASIVPQIIYAIFGTSRQLSVAPVAMDSLLVASGVSLMATAGTDVYIGLVILLAFLTGLFQLLLGVFRMGFITNLLSKPVISGFTSAAALIIGLSQIKYLLGVEIDTNKHFYEVFWQTIHKVNETHLLTFLMGVIAIGIIFGIKKINNRIPGALIAVILGTAIVYLFRLYDSGISIVETIPDGLPPFKLPDFNRDQIRELVPLALTISVVSFMESFSVAKAIEASKKNHKVNANQELIALGASNMFGSMFQSFQVSGGFSRSAVNMESGANTPLSSIISAGLIIVTLLFLTPFFYFLPTTVLAAVIMVGITNLIDLKYAIRLLREDKIEFALLLITFLVTLNYNMVPGIVTGVALSILLLLYHAAYPHIAQLGRLLNQRDFRNIKRFKDLETWEDRLILRIDAPITFINIQYVREYIEHELDKSTKIRQIIIDASAISYVDATAINGISDLVNTLNRKGINFRMSEIVGPVRDALFRTGLLDQIGQNNVFLTLNDALEADNEQNYSQREKAIQHND